MAASSMATILGTVAIVTSVGLVMSPLPTFRRIVQERSVSDFQVVPYVVTLLQCSVWILYGLLTPDEDTLELLIMNSLCAGIELMWCCLYLVFSPAKSRVLLQLAGVLGFVVVIYIVDTFAMTNLEFLDSSIRSDFLGAVADTLCVLMYSAPLGVARQVIQTKSVEFMPLPLSALGLLNSTVNCGYGLALQDWWITVPNVGGIVLGAGQVILYTVIYSSKAKKDNVMQEAETQVSKGPEQEV